MTGLKRAAGVEKYSPIPGEVTIFSWPRAIIYYVHIALATVVIGLFGLPKVMRHGRRGAHDVASVWNGYLLRAARWHLGLVVELRGTPPHGDMIVAAKHQSFLDILAIAHALPERSFVMKREVMRVPVMGWYAYHAGCIPIDRSKGRDAMKQIISQINQRRAGEGLGQLIIYPEGTRTKPGEKRPYKYGVGAIYAATNLPCVPVAVNVALFWPKRGIPIRPGRAVIEFLPRIEPGLGAREFMKVLSDAIEPATDQLLAEAGFVLPASE